MKPIMSALNDAFLSGGTNAIILSILMRDRQILLCSYAITMGCLLSLQFMNKMIPPPHEGKDGKKG